jgi:23S rRNA pseudouridine1911/1915/1917 synthase
VADSIPFRAFEHSVLEEESGQRVDALLAAHLNEYSRVFLRKVVQDGGTQVDGEVVKPSFRVRPGQQIAAQLPPPPSDGPQPEEIPLSILYEDEHLIAVDKPPNMVVHPAKGHWSGTLTSALAFHFQQLSNVGGATRPGIVHRLDRDTSGVIVIAKTNSVHLALAAQFESRDVLKEYWAITLGKVGMDRDIVRAPIGPHPYQRDKMAIRDGHPDSREAETMFEVLERFEGYTVIRCLPKTGRTHQIRVHMAHVGTPVLCDKLYAGHSQITRGQLARRLARRLPPQPGDDDVVLNRQALHARRLRLQHPVTGETLQLESPLPHDLLRVVEVLREAQ